MASELDAQIAAELAAIQNAPQTPISQLQPSGTGVSGRCGFCGQVRNDLERVEILHDQERYAGGCCRKS